jgi:mannose-1-phosphate guanylyltransferase
MTENNFALIMAGGVGSRFWPASTPEKPKQFLDFLGTGSTLIQQTYSRMLKFCKPENIYVATNAAYQSLVMEQLPDIPKLNILAEPARRNTAPCIANAAYQIAAKNPKAKLLVAPSDHLILKEDDFINHVNEALSFLNQNDGLVTFGIKPTRPETGFGYLKPSATALENSIFKLSAFVEKPDLETAKAYLAGGNHFWNAGIFLFSLKTLIEDFAKFLPEIHEFYKKSVALSPESFSSALAEVYPTLPATSIDYGIMEKSERVFMLATENIGWNDLGTWSGIGESLNGNENGNHLISGNIVTEQVNDSVVMVPKGKKALIRGLNNYIVVDSGSALLIYPKINEQEIKKAVETAFKK